MRDIPHSLRESAQVLGLTPWATLWQIELPLASRTILAGIKTTAVMTVGYATLGGLIGAGGFGTPIQSGLSKGDNLLTMEGAIPAAVLALLVKSVFEIAERFVVPKGLRVQSQG
jgi:osmoprotectant transport system permease protein